MITNEIKLEIDACYSEYELINLKLKPLDNQGFDYFIYEKDSRIYYFEQIDPSNFRLFMSTSKHCFYLS